MSLDLEQQLRFYGAYHSNPINVAIHMTCVPLILMTGLMLASNSPNLSTPEWFPSFPINLGTVAAFLYSSFYLLMEPVAGGLSFPLIMAWTVYSNRLLDVYGASANYWAIAVQVVTWVAQFIGHGMFEGRAPALLDNLVQALVLAPFFVWMAMLFALGYRPELKARLDKAIAEEVKKFRETKSANGNTNGKAKRMARRLEH